MSGVKLTEAERNAVDQGLADTGCHGFLGDHPDLYTAVERILTDRLAAVEALADEWDESTATGHPDCRHDEDCVGCAADDLRAALTTEADQ